MKQRLIFEPIVGADNFRFIWDGIVLGASRGETKAETTIRSNARLQRSLIKVSHEAAEKTNRPINARDLNADGGEVIWETGDIEHAKKLVLAVPWGGAQDIAIADLLDWIARAPTVEEA